MGVPLERDVFFIFSLFYLFGHYGSIRATDLRLPLSVGSRDRRGDRNDQNPFPEKCYSCPQCTTPVDNRATSLRVSTLAPKK